MLATFIYLAATGTQLGQLTTIVYLAATITKVCQILATITKVCQILVTITKLCHIIATITKVWQILAMSCCLKTKGLPELCQKKYICNRTNTINPTDNVTKL